jgi:hypothetical protein
MIRDRRTASYIAIALIVGVALALAVALSRTESSASTLGNQTLGASQTTLADDALAADPAKKQPSLDEFTSKDPFVPLDVANDTSNTAATTTSTSTTSSVSNLSAHIKVNGGASTVAVGDKVPGDNPVFKISGISAGDVTFALISGQFSDGSSTVTVASGDAVQVVNSDNDKTYTLTVVSIGNGGSGSGSSGTSTSTSGHSITVASITGQNGTALVTLTVDGKTYSDKKQGDTFSTSWGSIKILSISVNQQTVTIMHGDATITLNANQTIIK